MTWAARPRRGTTAQQGYGGEHQKLRAWWAPQVEAGRVDCHAAVCLQAQAGRGRRIRPGTAWHLGHTPDRRAWTGPEHAACNIRDGAVRGGRRAARKRAMRRAIAPPSWRSSRPW